MWKFFKTKEWFLWAYVGAATILGMIWYQVQLDVKINVWFGDFYNLLQSALASPNSVSITEFYGTMLTFGWIAGLWVAIAVIINFIASHWVFRWRTSMTTFYHSLFHKAQDIEGASQRVQEDTLKFARIVEDLGVKFVESILLLIAFIPILFGLSKQITELPFFGQVDNSLIWVAIIAALGGTILLAIAGAALPGIEYDVQKEEAAYRKELVMGEDNDVKPASLKNLYSKVRTIHYRSYFHYLYFNAVRIGYLQGMVLVPYIALAPTIIAGAVTLGFVSQIVRAFGKVAESLQYLVRSWHVIVELLSVRKRLAEFERRLK